MSLLKKPKKYPVTHIPTEKAKRQNKPVALTGLILHAITAITKDKQAENKYMIEYGVNCHESIGITFYRYMISYEIIIYKYI